MAQKNKGRSKIIFVLHLHGRRVKVLKGIRNRNGEFFVRIYGQKERVSIWSLPAPMNNREMEFFFQKVFKSSYQDAKRIHKELKKISVARRTAKKNRDALRRQIRKFKAERLILKKTFKIADFSLSQN